MFNFGTSGAGNIFGGNRQTGFSGGFQQPQSGSQIAAPGSQVQPSFFGTNPSAALPTIAQPVTGTPYPKETKFLDLPNETRASLEAIEKTMHQFMEQSAVLNSKTNTGTMKISSDIHHFEARLVAAESANEMCRGHLLSAKKIMNQFWKYGESVARMIVSSKQHNAADGSIKWIPVITPSNLALFEEMIGRLEVQIAELSGNASSLSRQLEQSSFNRKAPLDSVTGSLKNLHDFFVNVTSKISSQQEELEKIKLSYKNFILRYRNDSRDPFSPKSANPSSNSPSSATISSVNDRPPQSNLPAVPIFFSNEMGLNSQNRQLSVPAGGGSINYSRPTPANPPLANPFLQTPK